jgi:hypothetical protein
MWKWHEWRCQLELAADRSGVEANGSRCELVRYALGNVCNPSGAKIRVQPSVGSALLALPPKGSVG